MFGKNCTCSEGCSKSTSRLSPENQMARRLLWAQRGDFASSLTFLQLWSQINVPLKEVEPETTVASVTQDQDASINSNLGAPLMFLGQEAIDSDELTAEITREFVFAEFSKSRLRNFDSFQEEQVTQAIDFMLSDTKADTEFGIEKKKKTGTSESTGQ